MFEDRIEKHVEFLDHLTSLTFFSKKTTLHDALVLFDDFHGKKLKLDYRNEAYAIKAMLLSITESSKNMQNGSRLKIGLQKLAQKHKEKAGVGLYIDDVEFPTKAWEQELCRPEIFRGDCYWAPVDTTLAVYPPNIDFTPNAVRSAAPYLARHMGWYASLDDPEFAYYTNRAVRGPNGTSWFHQREA